MFLNKCIKKNQLLFIAFYTQNLCRERFRKKKKAGSDVTYISQFDLIYTQNLMRKRLCEKHKSVFLWFYERGNYYRKRGTNLFFFFFFFFVSASKGLFLFSQMLSLLTLCKIKGNLYFFILNLSWLTYRVLRTVDVFAFLVDWCIEH